MRVLVVFGSKHGATEELAQWVSGALKAVGHESEARSAEQVVGLDDWDAVVIGGALYAGRWPRQLARFVAHHRDELMSRPVWLFSSGPLGESAKRTDIPPPTRVARVAKSLGARGHVTLGGRLDAGSSGVIGRAMAKGGLAGDYRDRDATERWARSVAAELAGLEPLRRVGPHVPLRWRTPWLRVLAGLTGFTGLTAIGGGIELIAWPEGNEYVPIAMLEGTGFDTFLWPGLMLLALVGLPNLHAALAVGLRAPGHEFRAFVAGGLIFGWIVIEMILLGAHHWLHDIYLVAGGLSMLIAVALRWARSMTAEVPTGPLASESSP